jgi:hypothetical protein
MPGLKVATEDREWPNLFVVGAARAGTTSLWRYLDAHPEIFMSPVKEPCFFAPSPLYPIVTDSETYLKLFSRARGERFKGEASTAYLGAENASAEIQRLRPDARILISLREPVAQCHANYILWHRLRVDPRSFRQVIREQVVEGRQLSLRRGDATSSTTYTGMASYTGPVKRYLDAFGEQVCVIFFEDLIADPRGVVRRLFKFLKLDPGPADHFDPVPHNAHSRARNPFARRVLRSGRAFQVARAIVPASWRYPIFRRLLSSAEKPEPDPETVELLKRVFEPDVLALRDLLGRRLPEAWERRFPAAAPSQPRPDQPSRGPAIEMRRA